jgi:hypothetical protein
MSAEKGWIADPQPSVEWLTGWWTLRRSVMLSVNGNDLPHLHSACPVCGFATRLAKALGQ